MCKYACSDIVEARCIAGAVEKDPLIEVNDAEIAEPSNSLGRGEIEV
jgi:hypothetical protein